MNKLIHGSNVSGQSIVDRALAAKHTVAGQSLAKVICKATTEEVMGPKRKHLDYLLHCTNEQNVSIPSMANLLIERTQNTNWVVVFKALVTVHNLMNYGNERFMQCLASNNCTFNLGSFADKSGTQGYDMSTYIRQYSKYLNEKAFSYRQMAFDFCKVKRGKEDGLLRTMNADKLLKTLPVLQAQLDALVEFDVSPNELTNGVINAAFMLLFKDLIRLFACYNDGIINLLEKYFDMNKKQCREALDVYKKFLARMDRVCEFLKVAESVGIDKGDIPDLAKAPSSLLEALEQHLTSLENSKKTGSTVLPKPAAGVSAAISNYAAASQVGTAPGAGADVAHITEEERQRILEEEQRQLDQMKQQRLKQMPCESSPVGTGTSSSASSSRLVATSAANNASPSNSANHSDFLSSENPPSNHHNEDLFALSAPPSFGQPAASNVSGNTAFLGSGGNPFGEIQVTATPLMHGTGGLSGQSATTGAWGSPTFAGSAKPVPASQTEASQFATDANFAAVFGAGSVGKMPTSTQKPATGFDGFGEILKPTNSASATQGQSGTPINRQDKLMRADLDSSLASLAGGLSIQPVGQVKKTDHQWTTTVGEKKLTGGGSVASSGWSQPMAPMQPTWNQSPAMGPSSYQMVQPMPILVGMPAGGMQVGVMPVGGMAAGGMPVSGMSMAGQAPMMAVYPTPMVQPRPVAMNQTAGTWGSIQPQPFTTQRPTQAPSQQSNAPNDPFGAL